MKGRPGNPGLKGKLLEKSIEAFILSLEVINQLSVKYRIETFAYLICNTWELLLKAKLIEDTKARKTIYYPKNRNQPRRSLSLVDCLRRIFTNEKEPIRRNLEHIINLRDESVHLVISRIPLDIIGLFQACVLNYHKKLIEWFNINLSDRIPIGMMSIVYDFNPEQFDVQNPIFRRQLGNHEIEYLTKFKDNIAKEYDELGKPAEFSIDIDYRLALVKKPGQSDIILATGNQGLSGNLIEVPKDPCITHPYRGKEIIEQINSNLNGRASINQYDIQCICKVFNMKQRSEFYYKGRIPGSPTQYSQQFIEWILNKFNQDNTFFMDTRQKMKNIN